MSWTVVEKVRRVVGEDVFLEAIEIVAGDLLENEWNCLYIVEDEGGNRKEVIARDNYELGEKIAESDFQEVD